jgi:hypothetical protein
LMLLIAPTTHQQPASAPSRRGITQGLWGNPYFGMGGSLAASLALAGCLGPGTPP